MRLRRVEVSQVKGCALSVKHKVHALQCATVRRVTSD
jgi:hypothetical protein